jgi:hypothetical protein
LPSGPERLDGAMTHRLNECEEPASAETIRIGNGSDVSTETKQEQVLTCWGRARTLRSSRRLFMNELSSSCSGRRDPPSLARGGLSLHRRRTGTVAEEQDVSPELMEFIDKINVPVIARRLGGRPQIERALYNDGPLLYCECSRPANQIGV